MTPQDAAAAALVAHDALRASHDREPELNEDGLPLDAAAWLDWHERDSRPAFAAWRKAMDELDTALGESVSRHPFTFRPICERLCA